MPFDFKSARFWAMEHLREAIQPGDCVIDATMGNGHDTEWLCQRVEEAGTVYAFDIQPDAVESTRKRLIKAGLIDRARLLCANHADMAQYVPAGASAAVFNLGWLPGGRHELTTRAESTLVAVNAALELIKPGGLVSICVYPGHAEGARELEALLEWAGALNGNRFQALVTRYVNQRNDPPVFIGIKKSV